MFIDLVKMSSEMDISDEALLKKKIKDFLIIIRDDLMLIELSIEVKNNKQILSSVESIRKACDKVSLEGICGLADDVEKAIYKKDLIIVNDKFLLLKNGFGKTIEAFESID